MERELLQRVLQRPLLSRSLMAARLTGWRRCAVHGHDFPAVLRCRGSAVDGVVLDHVSSTDREKLIAYEGEGYTTARAVGELPARASPAVRADAGVLHADKCGLAVAAARLPVAGTCGRQYHPLEISFIASLAGSSEPPITRSPSETMPTAHGWLACGRSADRRASSNRRPADQDDRLNVTLQVWLGSSGRAIGADATAIGRRLSARRAC